MRLVKDDRGCGKFNKEDVRQLTVLPIIGSALLLLIMGVIIKYIWP